MYREFKIEKNKWVEELNGFSVDHAIEAMKGGWIEKNGSLLLITPEEDYRDVFIRDFGEMFSEEFTLLIEKYKPEMMLDDDTEMQDLLKQIHEWESEEINGVVYRQYMTKNQPTELFDNLCENLKQRFEDVEAGKKDVLRVTFGRRNRYHIEIIDAPFASKWNVFPKCSNFKHCKNAGKSSWGDDDVCHTCFDELQNQYWEENPEEYGGHILHDGHIGPKYDIEDHGEYYLYLHEEIRPWVEFDDQAVEDMVERIKDYLDVDDVGELQEINNGHVSFSKEIRDA